MTHDTTTKALTILHAETAAQYTGKELQDRMAKHSKEASKDDRILAIEFAITDLKPGTNPCHATVDDIITKHKNTLLYWSSQAYVLVGGYKRYFKSRDERFAA